MEAEQRIDGQAIQADVRATLRELCDAQRKLKAKAKGIAPATVRKLIGGPGNGETVQSNEPFITWIGRLRVGDYRLGDDGDYHFEGDKC